ncbi:MAG TPA: acyl-CoA carboxylase epsilon subunit [Streptosporangiaceae bacterium]
MAGSVGPAGSPPVLAVVRGDASATEIAALVAVLAARQAAAAAASAAAAAGPGGSGAGAGSGRGWGDRSALLRKPLSHGPGAWQASGRPG